jgi:pimeloyl-ACP methyl ester carboxylesterase
VPWLDRSRFTYAFHDYRGYGRRRHVTGQYSLNELVADALATVDALGWDRFAVLGHSMGGVVAQRLLVDAPDRVAAFVGISPVPATGLALDEQGWALFSGAATEPGNRRAIIDLTTGHRLPAAWLDAMVEHSLTTSTPEAFGAYLEAFAHADFAGRLGGVQLPALVIAGAHDPALGEAAMRQAVMPLLAGARLEVLADAGHYAMDEEPLAFVAAVEGFVLQGVTQVPAQS